MGIGFFTLIAVFLLVLASMWKVYEKAGEAGWSAFVPIYNIIVLLRIVDRPAWWILLFLIPIVNAIISLIIAMDLGKAFKQSTAFSIFWLWMFSVVGYMVIGFGKAEYVGVNNDQGRSAPTKPVVDLSRSLPTLQNNQPGPMPTNTASDDVPPKI